MEGERFIDPYTTRPNELQAGDKLCYVVVAIVGDAGDWAAYAGSADWTPEQVSRKGNKISRKAAEYLFPLFRDADLKWRD